MINAVRFDPMKSISRLSLVLAAAGFALTTGLGAVQAASEAQVRSKIRSATSSFRDLTMDVAITQANQKELAKIGADYGRAYEFKNSKLIFKSPDKYKMTAKAGIVNVTYVVTGDIKRIKAGVISKTDNIANEPHKKQTVLDVGIVTDTIWNHFNVNYERAEKVGNSTVYVLSLSLSNSPDKKQYIWVDDDMKLLKREKREANGSLRARYIYDNHKKYSGVWIPSEVRVYNGSGKLGGTSVYKNVKVNTGVSDSTFQ